MPSPSHTFCLSFQCSHSAVAGFSKISVGCRVYGYLTPRNFVAHMLLYYSGCNLIVVDKMSTIGRRSWVIVDHSASDGGVVRLV